VNYRFGGGHSEEDTVVSQARWSAAARAQDNDARGYYSDLASIPPDQVDVPTDLRDAPANLSEIRPLPPEPAPQPVPVRPRVTKKVSILLNVYFKLGKYDLRPKYYATMVEVARFLRTHPKATAKIEGHTDNIGSPEYNLELSQRRADSVRNYMIEHYGVLSSRLTAKGYGLTRPIVDNTTPGGRALNRRVIAIIDAKE
jgi:outer membrane protein OmpA-like peptidoglycan-associated protein